MEKVSTIASILFENEENPAFPVEITYTDGSSIQLATDEELLNIIQEFQDPLSPTQLILLIQLKTIWQIIHTREMVVADDLLQALIWVEKQDEAIEKIAQQTTHFSHLIHKLLALEDILIELGKPDVALFRESERLVIMSLAHEDHVNLAVHALARRLAQAGFNEWATQLAAYQPIPSWQASLLRDIGAGGQEAPPTPKPFEKLLADGDYAGAEAAIYKANNEIEHAIYFSQAGLILARQGKRELAHHFFRQAEQIIETRPIYPSDSLDTSTLAECLAAAVEFDWSEKVSKLLYGRPVGWFPIIFARELTKAGYFQRALQTAAQHRKQDSIGINVTLTAIYSTISLELLRKGQHSNAIQVIQQAIETIPAFTPYGNHEFDAALINYLNWEKRDRALHQFFQIRKRFSPHMLIIDLASAFPEPTILQEAEKRARTSGSSLWVRHLSTVAAAIYQVDQERGSALFDEILASTAFQESLTLFEKTERDAHLVTKLLEVQHPQSSVLMQNTLALIHAAKSDQARAVVMRILVQMLAKVRQFDAARNMAERIAIPLLKDIALANISQEYVQVGNFDTAFEIAQAIIDPAIKIQAYGIIAQASSQTSLIQQMLDESEQLFAEMTYPWNKLPALKSIATMYAQQGQSAKAIRLLPAEPFEKYLATLLSWHDIFEHSRAGLTHEVISYVLSLVSSISMGKYLHKLWSDLQK